MLTESPLSAHLGDGFVAVVHFDGEGFSLEVGVEDDPESFDVISYHADLLHAAIALVDVVGNTSVVDQEYAEAVLAGLQ